MTLHRLASITIGVPQRRRRARVSTATSASREIAAGRFATRRRRRAAARRAGAAPRRCSRSRVGVDDADDLSASRARARALGVSSARRDASSLTAAVDREHACGVELVAARRAEAAGRARRDQRAGRVDFASTRARRRCARAARSPRRLRTW